MNEFLTNVIRARTPRACKNYSAYAQAASSRNATAEADWKRFEKTVALFRRYGERYGFDYLMVAAQGYQESRLDQNARSHVGAIGIMQIMPATGAELGVGDITRSSPTSTAASSTCAS